MSDVHALGEHARSTRTTPSPRRRTRPPDFLASQARALRFFGGVPAALVSDQLRSGIVVRCRYEPGPHTAYLDFATHYGTALVPVRPRCPRDKAKLEGAVQVAQRWILARLRTVVFTSLADLNAHIAQLLTRYGDTYQDYYSH